MLKKLINGQNPLARFDYIENAIMYYKISLRVEFNYEEVYFAIPVSDIDRKFHVHEPAVNLLRWLIE